MDIDKESYVNFLGSWGQICFILFIVMLGLALLSFLMYRYRYSSAKDYKAKFDLASQSEISSMLTTQYLIAAGIFFLTITLKDDTVELHVVWFFIRIFIAFAFATLWGYVAFLVFKYYYPGPLSKKLERLRYTPRINPHTGNKMKLLSEEEEDAYLDEGQQAEENVFSVDYDVWIDPISGDTHIEKYKGHLIAHECDRCGFQTLRLVKEDVIQEATETQDGEVQQEFNCSYCGRIKRKTVKISKKLKEDFSNRRLIDDPLRYDKRIQMIKLEIHTKGDAKIFEFQNMDQIKHFLDEFDLEKLEEEVVDY